MLAENSSFIELFEISIRGLTASITSEFFFCNSGTVDFLRNGLLSTYIAFPIKITDIAHTSTGAPPRPKLTIATVDPLISQLAFLYDDIVGAKVTYIRTFEEYLNTGLSSYPLTMEILKKENHNKNGMTFELRFPTDRENDYLPKKHMLRNEFPGMGVNKRAT